MCLFICVSLPHANPVKLTPLQQVDCLADAYETLESPAVVSLAARRNGAPRPTRTERRSRVNLNVASVRCLTFHILHLLLYSLEMVTVCVCVCVCVCICFANSFCSCRGCAHTTVHDMIPSTKCTKRTHTHAFVFDWTELDFVAGTCFHGDQGSQDCQDSDCGFVG
jgi:hypothetical protein